MPPVSLPAGISVFERGWLSANNILLDHGGVSALIDSGYHTHAEQTLGLVLSTLRERPLTHLLNTHLHSDHCGGNARLQAHYPDVETHIPPGNAPHVAEWNAERLSYTATGQHCPKFQYDHLLAPGTNMELGGWTWQIHAAPGHDPDSVIFFEPAHQILISADALWENGFGVVFPELEGLEAFSDLAATLDLIARLGPKIIIPGHGAVFHYTPQTMQIADRRLEAFVRDPQKHARHAAKVLMKFKLLELQQVSMADFLAWTRATPHLQQIHRTHFVHDSFNDWVSDLFDDLCQVGAARRLEGFILNQ